MRRTLRAKLPPGRDSANLYQELKPTFLCLRVFGLAPFSVTDGGRLRASKKLGAQNCVLIVASIYCAYAVVLEDGFDLSKSALSVLMYKAIGSSKSLHVALCLFNFTCRTAVYSNVWSLIQEINTSLEALSIKIDAADCRKKNLLVTVAVIASAVVYFGVQCAAIARPLPRCFWMIAIAPPFYTTLLIFLFCVFTTKIRHRVSLVNAFLQKELGTYKANKRSAAVSVLSRSDWLNPQSDAAAYKFRILKIIHLKVYKAVKYLNKLFGFHFFIIFVLYFCTGTLYSFTIIRYFAGQTSRPLFLVTAYALAGDTLQIAFAIYGATVLEKEVHCTVMSVHKFLTLLAENDVNIENELQSYAIQLRQCRVGFSAAGFFSMDFTKLLQFGVAFFSNAVFFLQVDEIQKVKSGLNSTLN